MIALSSTTIISLSAGITIAAAVRIIGYIPTADLWITGIVGTRVVVIAVHDCIRTPCCRVAGVFCAFIAIIADYPRVGASTALCDVIGAEISVITIQTYSSGADFAFNTFDSTASAVKYIDPGIDAFAVADYFWLLHVGGFAAAISLRISTTTSRQTTRTNKGSSFDLITSLH